MKVFPQRYDIKQLMQNYGIAMSMELRSRGFYRDIVSLEHISRLGHPSVHNRDPESLNDGLEINAHFLSLYDGDIVREMAWSQYAFFLLKLERVDEALDALAESIASTERLITDYGFQYSIIRKLQLEDHRVTVLFEQRPDELDHLEKVIDLLNEIDALMCRYRFSNYGAGPNVEFVALQLLRNLIKCDPKGYRDRLDKLNIMSFSLPSAIIRHLKDPSIRYADDKANLLPPRDLAHFGLSLGLAKELDLPPPDLRTVI
ncbi:MAG: hypothetical protein P8N72_19185 [Flavimaricola sp.]|nr:hypothetical protein [Flavimaricola sp.]